MNRPVRYLRWDGTQDPFGGDLPATEIIDEIAEDVLEGWPLDLAMRRMLERGIRGRGLRDMRQRLQRLRERQRASDPLARYRERLQEILETEKGALAASTDESARFREFELEDLPPDLPHRLAALANYEWESPTAQADFEKLVAELSAEILDSSFRQLSQSMQLLTAEDLAAIKDMLADLNRLMEQRATSDGPSQQEFDEFMRKHGDFFPENPATFDELLEALARRAAAGSRFLAGLSESQRSELMRLADDLLADMDLAFLMDQFGRNLRMLASDLPWDQPLQPTGEFDGLSGAMEASERAWRLEELERALGQDYAGANLDDVDLDVLRESLGPEAVADFERLRKIERLLEEAGMASSAGGRMELTPRGVRKLGERALARVFEKLSQDEVGSHDVYEAGGVDEPTGTSRPWRFGDSFRLDLRRTIENAVLRSGPGPVHLQPEDLEIAESENRSAVATVLLLDMSRSMPLRGYWLPAKRMALALHTLISTMYPEDRLSIVGFSDYAREMSPADLAQVDWEPVYGTNMEHAFDLAGRLLARQGGVARQVLLVTDGEPTAHLEGSEVYFQWPPARRTLDKTYKAAMRLARGGATLNVFMLEESPGLTAFVDRLARIVKGRVFAVAEGDVGAVVLADYVRSR